MKSIVIAPHPDDEVLGVGGTLLRRKSDGEKIAWLIVTSISVENGWDARKVKERDEEIQKITELFGFDEVYRLNFPTTKLDTIPMSDLVSKISEIFTSYEPEEVFVPHPSDIHTDHRVVFDAVASCTKWFRYPSVKRVLAYETISETDFNLAPSNIFRPNTFVNIESFLADKLKAMDIYSSEMKPFPFPRSKEAITAVASVRGASAGFKAAEAFELLRERS